MRTTKEILTALGVSKPTPKQKTHAKTLAEVYTMLCDLPNVRSIEIKEQPFFFGREYGQHRWNEAPYIRVEGQEMKGEKWTFKTDTANYSVSLPVGNPLYYAFCNRFPSLVPQPDQEKKSPDYTLIFEEKITGEIKKAMKFIKYDPLRLAMNCVHVIVKNGYCEIMATNGVKLYKSGYLYFDESQKDITILLPIDALQSAKIKDNLTIGLYYNGETIVSGSVNDVAFDYCNEQPLDYNSVIPKYSDFVQFDKKELVQVLKSVLPSANKVTSKVNFYFNGCIEVSAEDINFSHENNVRISYLHKTCKDFKISFNGKFLLECLNSIDDKIVRLYSDGNDNKAIMINNQALLMPVMPYLP